MYAGEAWDTEIESKAQFGSTAYAAYPHKFALAGMLTGAELP